MSLHNEKKAEDSVRSSPHFKSVHVLFNYKKQWSPMQHIERVAMFCIRLGSSAFNSFKKMQFFFPNAGTVI